MNRLSVFMLIFTFMFTYLCAILCLFHIMVFGHVIQWFDHCVDLSKINILFVKYLLDDVSSCQILFIFTILDHSLIIAIHQSTESTDWR